MKDGYISKYLLAVTILENYIIESL